ncbi:hypothetical protein PYCCODRAFT_1472461 [Trametes coccinea BRFM310]|uniref:Uncharacterized protein n=1 Tax=Trametes coccinea (strain BRFM310) TaxID=1353009 RepID=A0A1Y2I841_TRAC3|nr:hypothetical protein PYCCODRAFT_1472461 [Trametes coccinea BRFM310]
MEAPKLVHDSSIAPFTSPASSNSAENARTQGALLLFASVQNQRTYASRTSLSAAAAPYPSTSESDFMDGVEASLAEELAVRHDDDAMNADPTLFNIFPYEECSTPAPSPAQYSCHAPDSLHEAIQSPYEDVHGPFEVA